MKINDIQDPSFLKHATIDSLEILSEDIRAFLLEKLAKTGGHLSSNLGVVELTIALHKVFESPKDHLVFDVGHQGYVHKILTGRANRFDTLRKTDGLSGFLKRSESDHDVYEAGHSSTSIAAAAGFLFAKPYAKDMGHVVAVIGDGALGSGVALEALNFLGHYPDKHPIIILNDNAMSIGQNVGRLAQTLTRLRARKSVRLLRRKSIVIIPKFMRGFVSKTERRVKGFIQGTTYFESLGYQYFGPVDGHNFNILLRVLEAAKNEKKPCVVHVVTQKGKGYHASEIDTTGDWHGVSPKHFIDDKPITSKHSYSHIVAEYLEQRALNNPQFKVITPAMVSGSGLTKFQARFPLQLIDVGIAEATALILATGLALKHQPIVLAIYSTFLQRAYDQLLHDVCMHNADVVIGIDRAGLVGSDGPTHHGIYDIPLMMPMPNLVIAQGKDSVETMQLFDYALDHHQGPIAIRYPKAEAIHDSKDGIKNQITDHHWPIIHQGTLGTIIAFGPVVEQLHQAIQEYHLDVTLINARFIKPIDTKILAHIDTKKPLIIHEESVLNGGLGTMILKHYASLQIPLINVHLMGFNDQFVEQGDQVTILQRYGLDCSSIIEQIKVMLNAT